jgi:nucleoid-associated protein YgaU
MLVTAGRAAPGAEVTLLEGGHELGRARADARGEWVILPTEPLTPGLRELSLSARLAGQDQVAGAETVVLLVPEQPAASGGPGEAEATTGAPAESASLAAVGRGLPARGQSPGQASNPSSAGALALLLPPAGADAAPRVLQTPAARQSRLSVDVVDYDQAGAMRFAGSAPPGAMVRLYVGTVHVGDAEADQAGRWVMAPSRQPGFGRHLLRADQVGAHGEVVARVEVPFQRDELPQEMLRDGRVVVQPGHSLWRLARLAYGRGVRYTVIYEANRDQIREPSLIYPGQVFALPGNQH